MSVSEELIPSPSEIRKKAEQGDVEAQNNLGDMYFEGTGVSQDYKQALKWLTKATAQGHAGAHKYLAGMYYSGMGVTKDPVEAYAWALNAAMHGDPSGINYLAPMLTPEQITQGQIRAGELALEMQK